MGENTTNLKTKTINLKGVLYELSTPLVMGILNLTPDSFFDGGKYNSTDSLSKQIEKLIEEGADIIDVGGYSSRPGADEVSEEEEKQRLEPALELLSRQFSEIPVSVDTFRSGVARWSSGYNIAMINDISAGELDPAMFETMRDLQLPYVMMHMQGTPKTMQENPSYEEVVEEVFLYLSKKAYSLRKMGVNDIIIDVGFGFGKRLEHNYQLLKALRQFDLLECPMLVGVSRKSMINKVLKTTPDKALNGTTILNTIALLNGASILRVHDVKEAKEAVKLVQFYKQA